jgi:DNA invertase Pin-like site-specific DNA recombinase
MHKRLLDAMKDGTVNGLLCWHTDRLYRSMRDLERLIEVADATAAKRSATFIDEMCQMTP